MKREDVTQLRIGAIGLIALGILGGKLRGHGQIGGTAIKRLGHLGFRVNEGFEHRVVNSRRQRDELQAAVLRFFGSADDDADGKEPEKVAKLIKFHEFTLDMDRYILRRSDKIIPLTLSEFGILRRLISNCGKVLTRNQLLDDINNDDAFIVDRNIDVHIASLRKKLGPTFKWIETVRGIGYRFQEDCPLSEK